MADSKVLHILWTNDNVLAAQLMVMMYAINSMTNRWWDGVTVICWGATVKLTAENEAIQEQIKLAQHVGVKFSACVSCARQLGVTDKLEELGIEVTGWGEPLTRILQNGDKLLTI